jgi:hypothetical protein
MYRVQIFYKTGRWIDHAAPGCEPDTWDHREQASHFAIAFMLRHRQDGKRARVVRDDDGRPVWPEPGPPPVAALGRVTELLEYLGGAGRPDDGGYSFRLPRGWRPAALLGLARAELAPHGCEVALRRRRLLVRYVGPTDVPAEQVFRVCGELNRQHGRGDAVRAEFTGPDRGHVVVRLIRVELRAPFELQVWGGRHFVWFLGQSARLRSPRRPRRRGGPAAGARGRGSRPGPAEGSAPPPAPADPPAPPDL